MTRRTFLVAMRPTVHILHTGVKWCTVGGMRTKFNMHERRLLDYLRQQPPEQVAELLRWDAEKDAGGTDWVPIPSGPFLIVRLPDEEG